jgi:hypothetical protein
MRAAVVPLAFLLGPTLILAVAQDKSTATTLTVPSAAPFKSSNPDAAASQLAALAQSVSSAVDSDLSLASKATPSLKCNKKKLIVRKNWYISPCDRFSHSIFEARQALAVLPLPSDNLIWCHPFRVRRLTVLLQEQSIGDRTASLHRCCQMPENETAPNPGIYSTWSQVSL